MTTSELALWLSGPEDDTGWESSRGGEPTRSSGESAQQKALDDQLARLRNGDVLTFEALFFEHASHLRRFVKGMVHSVERAEEIVQDVFAHVWETREQLHIKATLRAYLYASARGRALTLLRADRVREAYASATMLEDIVVIPPDTPNALARIEKDELTRALAAALSTLPSRTRQAAQLRWFSKLSHAEVASVMGISPATVNNQLTTALKALRERLAPYIGIISSLTHSLTATSK